MKKIALLLVSGMLALCLTGCAQKCVECSSEIEDGTSVEVNGDTYCANCVEHCSGCDTPFAKSDSALLVFEGNGYCQECFNEVAYPIVLKDTDKYSMSIVGYDDAEGMVAVSISNKTDYEISTYETDGSAIVDGTKKCVAETGGMLSFAYADVPANEDLTVLCSFRAGMPDGWETVYKVSEGHSFEVGMNVWQPDPEYWKDTFKVELTPEMFGY